jgi:hypothetical protein
MQEKKYEIYQLKDPITNEIKYVGVTTNGLSKRLSQHISDVKRRPELYKAKWINSLLKQNLKPVIELIEVCDILTWEEREIYWIKKYKDEGLKLTNLHPGGAGICLAKRRGNKNSKITHKYDIDGNYIESFKSSTEAAKAHNVKVTSINRVLTGNRGTCAGFQWSYIKFDKLEPFRNSQHFKIRCYKMVPEFYKDFNTLQEAMNEMRATYDAIAMSIEKKRPSKGFLYEKI